MANNLDHIADDIMIPHHTNAFRTGRYTNQVLYTPKSKLTFFVPNEADSVLDVIAKAIEDGRLQITNVIDFGNGVQVESNTSQITLDIDNGVYTFTVLEGIGKLLEKVIIYGTDDDLKLDGSIDIVITYLFNNGQNTTLENTSYPIPTLWDMSLTEVPAANDTTSVTYPGKLVSNLQIDIIKNIANELHLNIPSLQTYGRWAISILL